MARTNLWVGSGRAACALFIAAFSSLPVAAQMFGAQEMVSSGFLERSSLDVKQLNHTLRTRYDYPALQSGFSSYGLMSQLRFGNVLAVWEQRYHLETTSANAEHSAAMSGWSMFGSGGYVRDPIKNLALFLIGGAGLGRENVSIWQNSDLTSFPDIIGQARGVSISKTTVLFQLAAGAQYFFTLSSGPRSEQGIVVGVVGGYVRAVAKDWSWRGRTLEESDRAGLTGPYARFTIGYGARGCPCGG